MIDKIIISSIITKALDKTSQLLLLIEKNNLRIEIKLFYA